MLIYGKHVWRVYTLGLEVHTYGMNWSGMPLCNTTFGLRTSHVADSLHNAGIRFVEMYTALCVEHIRLAASSTFSSTCHLSFSLPLVLCACTPCLAKTWHSTVANETKNPCSLSDEQKTCITKFECMHLSALNLLMGLPVRCWSIFARMWKSTVSWIL